MEATEFLLSNNFSPRRSFIIAFGHDEEGKGLHGAAYLAQTLQAKGVTELEYLLDEGTVIMNKSFIGIDALVAM